MAGAQVHRYRGRRSRASDRRFGKYNNANDARRLCNAIYHHKRYACYYSVLDDNRNVIKHITILLPWPQIYCAPSKRVVLIMRRSAINICVIWRVGDPKVGRVKWQTGGRILCNIILLENDDKSSGTRNTITSSTTREYEKIFELLKLVPLRRKPTFVEGLHLPTEQLLRKISDL